MLLAYDPVSSSPCGEKTRGFASDEWLGFLRSFVVSLRGTRRFPLAGECPLYGAGAP